MGPTPTPQVCEIFSLEMHCRRLLFFLCLILSFLVEGAEGCDDCPSGTYCLSGEGIQPCPAGHYCLGGGVEGILPCPPGTYSPQFGLSQVEQCLICPAGESIVTCLLHFFGRDLKSCLWWTGLQCTTLLAGCLGSYFFLVLIRCFNRMFKVFPLKWCCEMWAFVFLQ